HPRGLRRGGQHGDAGRGEHCAEGGGELRVPVPDQVSEPVTGLIELTGEVAGELAGPLARGVCRDPGQSYPPGPGLDDERDVQALEREHAADVEQVRSQHRGGVGAQESRPGLVTVRWWRDTMSTQDLADSGSCDPVPEPAQLALDAHYSPAPV